MNEINITRENSYSDKIILNEEHFGIYYSYEDILNTYPDFNKAYFGRKVLQKYNFVENDYNYILYSSKLEKYKFYDETFCKAKLFFKKHWIDKTMIEIKKDYINLPPLLQIDDIPNFFKKGEYVLKFRGEKSKDKIYISVESVAKILELNVTNLKNNIIKNNYNLEKNKHYILCGYKDKNNKLIKTPYFTYNGFISYLFMTRSPNALDIVSFCETVLFNSMFGTSEEKTEMVLSHIIQTPKEVAVLKKKLGVAISESKKMISIFGKVSCLYFLILEERKNTYIVKFGLTDDLNRRMNEHLKIFGNVYIKICRYIDSLELMNAEKELHTYFNKNYTSIKNWPENIESISNNKIVRKEIFEVKKCEINNIKKLYNDIGIKYGEKVRELNKNTRSIEKNIIQEKKDLIHKYELICKDKDNKINILENNIEQQKKSFDIIINQKDENFKKDIENLNLKLEMANLRLSIFSK